MKRQFLAFMFALASALPATGADMKIGLAAPLSGDQALLGTQMLDGATEAAAASGALRQLAIVNEAQVPLIRLLARHGIEAIGVPLRHCRTLSGNLHCVTLDIRRRGALESYA